MIGKEYGKSIAVSDLPEAFRRAFPSSSTETVGPYLQSELLLHILDQVRSRLKLYLRDVRDIEWRLRGSSLLIIYEGDIGALREALSGDDFSKNSYEEFEDASDEEDEDDEDGSNTSSTELKNNSFHPGVLVKAVDFAHVWDFEGQGSDEGYIIGCQSLVKCIDGRMIELQAELSASSTYSKH